MPPARPHPPRTAPPRATRDTQRARVYAAETAWEGRLDAARRGARRAEVAGSAVLLPQERLFGTLAAAQAYADELVARHGWPPVRLRERKGQTKAHWESPTTGPAVIALPVPPHGRAWAMREAVLLHELTHHACWYAGEEADHGPAFTARLLAVVADALGPEAAFALRVDLAEHGVEVAR